MATIADVYRALNSLLEEGVVEGYAVCGGTGALFYAETLRTYDIDIFVVTEQKGLPADVSPIYNWARGRGYEVRGEHLIIHGVPVQVLDASAGMEREAVQSANIFDYDGVPVPVVRPEYLVLFYAQARGRNRIARALDLLAVANPDVELIEEVVARYDLESAWGRLKEDAQQ